MSRALRPLEVTMHSSSTPSTPPSPPLSIGEILRRAGVVTQAEIDDALALIATHEMRLGQALVAIGACTVDDVRTALDRQERLARVGDGCLAALGEILEDGFAAMGRATACPAE
jgi:hypothetical protein